MGRSLTNTMINLGIQGACDEAMYQVLWSKVIVKMFILKVKISVLNLFIFWAKNMCPNVLEWTQKVFLG